VVSAWYFLLEHPNFWYASRQENGGGLPAVALVTKDFLFKRLQFGFPQKFFAMWHASLGTQGPSAAILKFRATPPAP
jgi:hypothetical protein